MGRCDIEKLNSILENILGSPKNGGYTNGWRSYNCPYCADLEGREEDGKFNLEVNIEHGAYFHCWKCKEHGSIRKLVKDYGGSEMLRAFDGILSQYKDSLYYKSSSNPINNPKTETTDDVTLPECVKPISLEDGGACEAINYLKLRGIGEDMVVDFGLHYTGNSEDFTLRKRVIIPSYDEDGKLNYWVGRDYTEHNKFKYKNAKISKTDIVFNCGKINWYEDITLVEGPFDHIVVPNSIPLLGKSLTRDYAVYKAITTRCYANVNILLDDDALSDAIVIYGLLDNSPLKGRVRLIECPEGYDAALVWQKFGKRGIIRLFQLAKPIHEYYIDRERIK